MRYCPARPLPEWLPDFLESKGFAYAQDTGMIAGYNCTF